MGKLPLLPVLPRFGGHDMAEGLRATKATALLLILESMGFPKRYILSPGQHGNIGEPYK